MCLQSAKPTSNKTFKIRTKKIKNTLKIELLFENYFSYSKPFLDDLNGQNEEPYVRRLLSKFQLDPTVNVSEHINLPRLLLEIHKIAFSLLSLMKVAAVLFFSH